MIRLGGWVVPLRCDNPLLAEWLSHLRLVCSFLGIPCDTYIDPALGVCPQTWTPMTIFLAALGLTVFLLSVLYLLGKQFIRWVRSRGRGTTAAMAGRAARSLHRANPSLYPPVGHSWYRLPEENLRVPSVCAECYDTLQPDMDGKKVQCCEICGVLCHENCSRKMPQDCRPVAEAGSQMMHLWKPAGCVLQDDLEEDWQSETQRYCLYCSGICEADIFTQEPIWSCAWCQTVAHVRCFRDYHALYGKQPLSHSELKPKKQRDGSRNLQDRENGGTNSSELPGKEQNGEIINGDKGSKNEIKSAVLRVPSLDLGDASLHNTPKRKKKGRQKHKHKAYKENAGPYANDVAGMSNDVQSLKGSNGGLQKRHTRTSSRGFGSFIDLFALTSSRVSSEDDLSKQSGGANGIAATKPPNLDQLDTCLFGSHQALVLPPTAVKVLPPHTWSEKAKELLGRTPSKDRRSLGERAESLPSEIKGGAQRVANWWGDSHVSWSNYKIENVPPGCKPLLVFLNIKSGPQSGTILRRKLLRLLNPIQVVELPKEKPEEALNLFAEVENLRVLVMGGDGTAGWILGCLDQIQEARSQGLEPHAWSPPPVAVIPMGTGNDLARCLGWGGGLQEIMHKGMQSLLRDVEVNAIVSLLDRWTVKITPTPHSSSPKGKITIMKGFSQPEASQESKRPMNNYIGIGVDARTCLDFHALRDSYPKWFRSQMGNKLWYTTVGAKDIIGHTSRGLAKNIQVECDGNILHLPEDIEGLLILNINSYMGGVNLWSSGASWQSGYESPPKQSICDGKLELVAVYGSWHLGQLQVGLSAATRLRQCRSVKITAKKEVPVQVDGEPWMQAPAVLQVDLKMKAFMLRKTESEPLSRMAKAVADALEGSTAKGIITTAQRRLLTEEIASRLHPSL